MKVCTKCKVPKDTADGFYRDRLRPDGFYTECKQCIKERNRVIALARAVKKTCSGCNAEKKLTLFHHRDDAKDGRNSRCKECVRQDRAGEYQKTRAITESP